MSLKLVQLFFLIILSYAERRSGSVNLDQVNGFGFLGKFCFRHDPDRSLPAGTIKLDLTLLTQLNLTKNLTTLNNVLMSNYLFILYDDEPTSWITVYNKNLTCHQKIKVYDPTYCKHCPVRARQRMFFTNKTKQEIGEIEIHKMHWGTDINIHQSIRPRFWWLYAVNCEPPNIEKGETFGILKYDIHFEQLKYSKWEKELGMNERYLNTVYIIFTIIYLILSIIEYIYYKNVLKRTRNNNMDKIMKLLIFSLFIETISLFLISINWINYSLNGVNIFVLQIIGDILGNLSYSAFLLLLLMLAQGWMISRNNLMYPKLLYLFVFITFISECIFYIWRMLIWYNYETSTYFYDSLPQYALGILMIIVCIVFITSSIYSYKQEDKTNIHKKLFYCLLPGFFSVWFLWYFFRIFIGRTLNPWVRDYITIIITLSWQTFTYISMMYFFYMITLKTPKNKNKKPHDKVSVPDFEDDDDDDENIHDKVEMHDIDNDNSKSKNDIDGDGDETTGDIGKIHATPNPLMQDSNTYMKIEHGGNSNVSDSK